MSTRNVDSIVAALVREERVPHELLVERCDEVLARAAWHGVDLLVARAIVADPLLAPQCDRGSLRERLRAAAANDLVVGDRVGRLTDVASARGCDLILLKGAAIGPLLYPASYLRPRLDTDIFIRHEDRRRVEALLGASGYAAAPEALGALGTGQSHWVTVDDPPVAVDLHWRLFNARAFAARFEFDELWSASQSLPANRGARLPSLEHQLILTATHRIAHHYDSPRLIWLYDLHLLMSALGSERLAAAVTLAVDRGIGAAVARSLSRAADAFGPRLEPATLRRLEAAVPDRLTRIFLAGAPSRFDLLWGDLAAHGDWPSRLRLVREHLMPPLSYMKGRYPRCPRALLAAAYLYRAVRGAPGWLRHPPAAGSE